MKYEIELIPTFGRKEIVIEQIKKLNISSTYEARSAGFFGSDTPVIIDIECDEEEVIELKGLLEACASGVSVYKRCSECNKIEMV